MKRVGATGDLNFDRCSKDLRRFSNMDNHFTSQ